MDSAVLIHRLHFAFTVTFHYLFPQLTMGLAPLVVALKTIGLWKNDERYHQAARFWAKIFGISQSRVSDLITGKWEKFSLEMLITLATKAGKQVTLKIAAWATFKTPWPVSLFLSILNQSIIIDTACALGLLFLVISKNQKKVEQTVWPISSMHCQLKSKSWWLINMIEQRIKPDDLLNLMEEIPADNLLIRNPPIIKIPIIGR